jgi:hypothetical protein
LKIIEKDIDVLSKTNAALKLIKGFSNQLISERAISDTDSLLNVAQLNRHRLETIMARLDNGAPLTSPFSPGGSMSSAFGTTKSAFGFGTTKSASGFGSTNSPVLGSIKSSGFGSTKSPGLETTNSPVLGSTKSPVLGSTKSPGLETTKSPGLETQYPSPSPNTSFQSIYSDRLKITTNPDKLRDEIRSPVLSVVYDSHSPTQEINSRDSLMPNGERLKYDSLCAARVKYDFEAARNSQEMSVKVGDLIEIMEKSEDG